MKVTVEQIAPERAEEVLLLCHDPKEPWVEEIQGIAAGQITVNGMADGKLCRLKLGDIYYFEVVDGSAFFYCQKEVFSSKQKLYEFESVCGHHAVPVQQVHDPECRKNRLCPALSFRPL